jgi:L-fuculose-phosphate aldolase
MPGRACLMRGHGITTVGSSVQEATLTAIKLNELAEMNYRAQLLGNPQPIPDDEIAHITRGDGKKSPKSVPLWRYYCSLVGEK